MSNLDGDLKRRYLTTDPACASVLPYETAELFLFLFFLYCTALRVPISKQIQYPRFVIAIPTSKLFVKEVVNFNDK